MGTYTYIGTGQIAGSTNTATASFTIGTGFLVFGLLVPNNIVVTSVTVNNILLNLDYSFNGSGGTAYLLNFYSGLLLSSGTTNNVVVVTTNGAFTETDVFIWLFSLGTSGTLKNSNGGNNTGSITINVSAGDPMFSLAGSFAGTPPAGNFIGSTENPANNEFAGNAGMAADWVIINTNASFSVANSKGFGCVIAAVTYTVFSASGTILYDGGTGQSDIFRIRNRLQY